uniref:MORN repeat-containing protein 3 n=2 Tax=Cuerna arida TaxID=1464854 RepID=A0A1B6GF70_9HEMI
MPFLKPYKEPRSRILEGTTKKNGLRHSIFNIKGDKYIGEWKNNLRHGKGSYLSKKKRLYEGDWVNGLKHGYGVLSQVMEDGTFILLYEGDWVKGKPEGVGRKHYPREEYYEGHVKAGKRHGHGRMWYADGSFYDGFWIDDMKDGLGLYVASNGNRYEGHWRADRKHGYGEYYHLDSGQMQFGLWNQGIAVCTNMRDIMFRQASQQPTPYPIPEVEVLDPELIYAIEYNRIAMEQVEPEPEVVEVFSDSPGPSLSPWFYVDCCDRAFPQRY